MLFNHLTYAAMRCTNQGFVTLDQLLGSIEIETRERLQQMAQYKEAALVQQGQRKMHLLKR
jgi:ribosome-binding ATPase YchF (GTP1/OBG family)